MAKAYAKMGDGETNQVTPRHIDRSPRLETNKIQGNQRLLTFHAGVLGIDFRDNLVVGVAKGGQADALGVRSGWRIVEVAGDPVKESSDIVKAIKLCNKDQSRFDVLFITPTWVKIAIPKEIGGGFMTIRIQQGITIHQLKKQTLKRCKMKRTSIIGNLNVVQADMHPSCFAVTDGTKELTRNQVFNPEAHHSGTIQLVRISKVKKSSRKKLVQEKENVLEEKKPPPMVDLVDKGEGKPRVSSSVIDSPKMEFVRVNVPQEAGGGFITLRVPAGTSASVLRELALAKVHQKRVSLSSCSSPKAIKPSEMKVMDSRLSLIIKKPTRPKNNVYRKIAMLLAETQSAKTQDLRLTFYPGLLGLAWRGNIVTQVLPNSQAKKAGVTVGWKVLAVNGIPMPEDGVAISKAIRETKDAGKNTQLLFAPSTLSVGTEVVLHNLKRNARLNGYSARITKSYGNNKYDVALLDTKTRTGIRGIVGDYLQMKHQEQFWHVMSPGGIKIYENKDGKSKGLGYLRYDTVIQGISTGNWLKHKQGYSRITDGEVQFLAQNATRRLGVVWPLAYKRKELHWQPCRVYEEGRRSVEQAIETSTIRQQELEEADMKNDDSFTQKQWHIFWASRNKYFGRYYTRILHQANKVVEAKQQQQIEDGFDNLFVERIGSQIEIPDQIVIPKPLSPPVTDILPFYGNLVEEKNEFDELDMITGTSTDDIFNEAFGQNPSSGRSDPPKDPFASSEPEIDPFALSDPFAGSDPFAEVKSDPNKTKLISS